MRHLPHVTIITWCCILWVVGKLALYIALYSDPKMGGKRCLPKLLGVAAVIPND